MFCYFAKVRSSVLLQVSHAAYKTPSCSPGSLFTRFCSQLSRSFAASFCKIVSDCRSAFSIRISKIQHYLPREKKATRLYSNHPIDRLLFFPRVLQSKKRGNSHSTPPSYQSSSCPCQSPISHPRSWSSLSDRVARTAARLRASGRRTQAASCR